MKDIYGEMKFAGDSEYHYIKIFGGQDLEAGGPGSGNEGENQQPESSQSRIQFAVDVQGQIDSSADFGSQFDLPVVSVTGEINPAGITLPGLGVTGSIDADHQTSARFTAAGVRVTGAIATPRTYNGMNVVLPGVHVSGLIGQESIAVAGIDVAGVIVRGAVAQVPLPGVRVSGQVLSGSRTFSSDVRLPRIDVVGSIGADAAASFALPGILASGEVVTDGIGSSRVRLPGLRLVGAIESEGLAESYHVGFRVSVSGAIEGQAGAVDQQARAAIRLPAVSIIGEILPGGIGEATFTVAKIGLSGSGYKITEIVHGDIRIPITVTGTIYGPAVSASRALSLNTSRLALSRYESFEFNSFATIGDKVFAAAPDGIHLLGGPVGKPAWFTTGHLNFGVETRVRIRSILVSYRTQGAMVAEIRADDSSPYLYLLDDVQDSGIYRTRLKVGRGISGQYFQMTFRNCYGSTFHINGIDPKVEALRRAA